MTLDEQALLRAVCVSPDDDAPRLVYADWLEERAGSVPCDCEAHGGMRSDPPGLETRLAAEEAEGSPTLSGAWVPCKGCGGSGRIPNYNAERAEFIRVQIEANRTPETIETSRYCSQIEWDDHPEWAAQGRRFRLTDPRSRVGVLYYSKTNISWQLLADRAQAILTNGQSLWPYQTNHRRWLGEQAWWGQLEAGYTRGFVCWVRLTAAEFLRRCDVIFERHPVTQVLLTGAIEAGHRNSTDVVLGTPDGSIQRVCRHYQPTLSEIPGGRSTLLAAALRGEWPGVSFSVLP